MAIWLSSGAFRTRDIAAMLAQAQAAGIREIELSSGMDFAADILQPVRQAHASGTHRFLVHNYFPPPEVPFVLNIASLDPDGLTQTRAFGEQALHLAKELDAPFYSIHAGFAARLRPEHLGQPGRLASALAAADIDRAGAYEVMVETTRYLADQAATLGLDLLIENNVISPVFMERMPINPLLLTSSGEIRRFFDDVQCSNVGLLLDVAHARVSATALGFSPEDFVENVAEYVRCLHLSDNNGREDSNQPINSGAWFLPRIRDFRGCEIVIEAYRLEPDEMKAQLALIQHYME
jgi:sugar phosphate isomerase/epimerase